MQPRRSDVFGTTSGGANPALRFFVETGGKEETDGAPSARNVALKGSYRIAMGSQWQDLYSSRQQGIQGKESSAEFAAQRTVSLLGSDAAN